MYFVFDYDNTSSYLFWFFNIIIINLFIREIFIDSFVNSVIYCLWNYVSKNFKSSNYLRTISYSCISVFPAVKNSNNSFLKRFKFYFAIDLIILFCLIIYFYLLPFLYPNYFGNVSGFSSFKKIIGLLLSLNFHKIIDFLPDQLISNRDSKGIIDHLIELFYDHPIFFRFISGIIIIRTGYFVYSVYSWVSDYFKGGDPISPADKEITDRLNRLKGKITNEQLLEKLKSINVPNENPGFPSNPGDPSIPGRSVSIPSSLNRNSSSLITAISDAKITAGNSSTGQLAIALRRVIDDVTQ